MADDRQTRDMQVQDEPCTVRLLLERNARLTPDLVMLRFDSGEQFTALELLNETRLLAANLHAVGIAKGELVITWFPNCPLAVRLYLALNYLGAVNVPINTAYRGSLLAHVLASSRARTMIADGRLIDRLEQADLAELKTLIVDGAERTGLDALQEFSIDILREPNSGEWPTVDIRPWDTAAVIFTSGTTGPSKGVLCSYLHLYTNATEFRHVGPGDTNLVALPMFHVGGVLGLLFALVHGGCAAFVERFSTSKFWPTVRELNVTSVGLLGAMVQYLMQQPPSPEDRNHPVKRAVIAPFVDDALEFGARFGIEVHTEFNMTELSVPLWAGPNPTARGTCGKPRAGVELRLVDEHDLEVAEGEVGELIVRSDRPWTISHGYLNNSEATARAWRNGWFHTGDLFYRDKQDNYFFVDRVKDMIRRRGENISSFEVEAEILAHPKVSEAAVVAAPGDGGEDEVLAVVTLVDDCQLDPKELIEFLQPRLADFMVPRYVRVVKSLPRTPTQKIEKHVLRGEGLTADTWDRVAAGVEVKRQTLEHR